MKVKPGDPFQIPASTWNRHDDAAEFIHRNFLNGFPSGHIPAVEDSNRVTVKNASGAARRRGEILEFNDFALSTDFADREIWLVGGAVTLANGFGVLLNPIPSGQYDAYCQVAGRCLALVNVTDADHKYAVPSASNYVLQSSIIGPVRIIYKPSGTGEKTCAVRLNDVVGECLVKNATGSDIAAGSSGTFQLWGGTPGSESYQNCDVTAYNKSSVAFKDGKFGAVSYLNGYAYAVPWQT